MDFTLVHKTAVPYFIYFGNTVTDWIIKKYCINMHKIFVPSAEANKRGDELEWEARGMSSKGKQGIQRGIIAVLLQHGVSQNKNSSVSLC